MTIVIENITFYQGTVAVGDNAVASGNFSVSLGNNAVASADNSVALGNGSLADQANTVSVGSSGSERRITNVAAGVALTDAVNFSQIQALGQGTEERANSYTARGIAAALALPPVSMPTNVGRTIIAVEMGEYAGEEALGFGLAYRMTEYMALNFGVSFDFDGQEEAFRGGLAFEF